MRISVTLLPQSTVICDGCGYLMRAEGGYVKGSDGMKFACSTSQCPQSREQIFIPYTHYSIESVGREEF